MSTDTQNFKINTDNYLGFEHEEYLSDLQALALSNPSEYYQIRRAVLSALKKGIIKEVFNTYYTLLTKGEVGSERPFESTNFKSKPNYPAQKASEFALGASKTINGILDDALEIILPANHIDVAHKRLLKTTDH